MTASEATPVGSSNTSAPVPGIVERLNLAGTGYRWHGTYGAWVCPHEHVQPAAARACAAREVARRARVPVRAARARAQGGSPR